MRRRLVRLAAALTLPASALAGCKSAEEAPAPIPIVVQTPLPVDPTERHDMNGWWVGRTSMLRLEEDGYYARYDGTNRFHAPIEEGRWSQPSYAWLRLEPYRLRAVPVRVDIDKVGDALIVSVPGGEPLSRFARPPAAPEEGLLGRWESDDAVIDLDESLRYRYAPRPGVGGATSVAGHRGRWRLDGSTVVLEPDTPGLEALTLDVEGDPSSRRLEGAAGVFDRPADE
ncbi:MAG: hypothetical protein ACYTG1_05735 [Planctomycetota bacterium]|jgi:hypothetical protein